MSQDPNQPPQPQWDAQQGRWVLPGQPQPQYVSQGHPYGQTAPYGHGQPTGGPQGQPHGQPSGQWPPQAPQHGPSKRRKWPWIVGAILLLFIVGTIANGGHSGTPSPTSATSGAQGNSGSAGSEPQGASGVVFEVAGSGTSTSISYGVNGGISQENGQQLPWSETVPVKSGFGIYALTAQSAGSGSITCRITVDGKVVAEQTSTGQYAVASCSGS